MNPTLVLSQAGAVYPVQILPTPNFVNLASPNGAQWLALLDAKVGSVGWVPKDTPGPAVNWVLVNGYYRCTPDNGATPIAGVVKVIGLAPTSLG